jgi:hypothetical protein
VIREGRGIEGVRGNLKSSLRGTKVRIAPVHGFKRVRRQLKRKLISNPKPSPRGIRIEIAPARGFITFDASIEALACRAEID